MNGILIMDKPAGFTSHDVVAKLRGIYHTRRIGHSGTLDPMATGVLPIFIGRATRAVEFAESDEKTYVATLRLGVTTDTQDTTGTVLSTAPVTCTEEEVRAACARFVGELEQTPPMYSAIRVDGKRLYELAREGKEIARPKRKITVFSIGVERCSDIEYALTVHCSKGTYIRTLCADIGAFLGCGGTMSSLRRTRAGVFTIADAHSFEDLTESPERLLLPVDHLFSQYPSCTVSASGERKCRNGAPVPYPEAKEGVTYRVYGSSGAFLMLAVGKDRTLKTVKSFFEVEEV